MPGIGSDSRGGVRVNAFSPTYVSVLTGQKRAPAQEANKAKLLQSVVKANGYVKNIHASIAKPDPFKSAKITRGGI